MTKDDLIEMSNRTPCTEKEVLFVNGLKKFLQENTITPHHAKPIRENIQALLIFYVFISTLLGGYTIYRQSQVIADLTSRQPIISTECIDGTLYRVQNFNGLKVYNHAFEKCD